MVVVAEGHECGPGPPRSGGRTAGARARAWGSAVAADAGLWWRLRLVQYDCSRRGVTVASSSVEQ
jgi:hypothetical protein